SSGRRDPEPLKRYKAVLVQVLMPEEGLALYQELFDLPADAERHRTLREWQIGHFAGEPSVRGATFASHRRRLAARCILIDLAALWIRGCEGCVNNRQRRGNGRTMRGARRVECSPGKRIDDLT